MQIVIAATCIVAGYFAGSVSTAIIVTHLVSGEDIRHLGNSNAGTANVARSIGTGYAAIVFFGDIAKAILPMLAARMLLHVAPEIEHTIVVLTGIAAVLGHCRPVYFHFRGGGGIATTFGAVAFVAPVELFVAMLAGFVLVQILVRASEYRLGRWTSGVILLIIPIVVTISSISFKLKISRYYRIGGYEWYVVAGVWIAVLFAIFMNRKVFGEYFRRLGGRGAKT